jgi:hypothetical protein
MITVASQFSRILVYSNVLIGLSAGILTLGWVKVNGIAQYMDYSFFAFFATVAIYNLDKLWKVKWVNEPSEWLIWIIKYNIIIWMLTISSAIHGFYFLLKVFDFHDFSSVIILLLGGICAAFYSIPFKKVRLRNIPGSKAFVIAFVWVLIVGLFPLMNTHLLSSASIYSLLFLFTFFIALTIPFDIRDIDKDEINLKTIPQVIGVKKAKYFGMLMLIFSLIFAIFIFNMRIIIFLMPVYGLCSWLIFLTNRRSSWWHFALIDLCILLIGLAMFI